MMESGGGDSHGKDRARLLLQQDRYDLAAAELVRALAENPDDSDAHAMHAFCLCALDRIPEALTEAQEAIRLSPDHPFPHSTLAYIYVRQRQWKRAEAAIREAIRLNPWDAEQFHLLGVIRAELGYWQEALEAAEQGLEVEADNVSCINLRAQALLKLKRKEEAFQTIDSALRFEPDNAMSHANMGWGLLETGDHKGAMEHFRESLRLDPTNEWARQGMLTAIKAKSPFYRVVMNYFFAMSRLPRPVRYTIIWGLWGLRQLLEVVRRTHPQFIPIINILSAAYFLFAFMTWTTEPLWNTLLRFHPYGKALLTRPQIVASNWVASTFGIALFGILVSLIFPQDHWKVLGYGFLFVTFLTAVTCNQRNLTFRWIAGIATVAVTLVVLFFALALYLSFFIPDAGPIGG